MRRSCSHPRMVARVRAGRRRRARTALTARSDGCRSSEMQGESGVGATGRLGYCAGGWRMCLQSSQSSQSSRSFGSRTSVSRPRRGLTSRGRSVDRISGLGSLSPASWGLSGCCSCSWRWTPTWWQSTRWSASSCARARPGFLPRRAPRRCSTGGHVHHQADRTAMGDRIQIRRRPRPSPRGVAFPFRTPNPGSGECATAIAARLRTQSSADRRTSPTERPRSQHSPLAPAVQRAPCAAVRETVQAGLRASQDGRSCELRRPPRRSARDGPASSSQTPTRRTRQRQSGKGS
jgi:hypothetical protein